MRTQLTVQLQSTKSFSRRQLRLHTDFTITKVTTSHYGVERGMSSVHITPLHPIESVLVLAIFYSVTIVWNVKGQGSKLHLIESVLVLAIFYFLNVKGQGSKYRERFGLGNFLFCHYSVECQGSRVQV